MPPIALALAVLEGAIEETPALLADLKLLFGKDNVTPADFAALREKVSAESYGQFVPDSALSAD
jgi:hypothetical protein